MRIAIFDSKRYDRAALNQANKDFSHKLEFFEDRLNRTTVPLAAGFDAVCPFVNDRVDAATIEELARLGVKLITLRSAGFNSVDVNAAAKHGIKVMRVPAYSPEGVAEHVFALLLTLVRRTHRAYTRVRDGNFSLDGLVGFNLHGRTFGVVGAGKIGIATLRIAKGFGMKLIAYDRTPNNPYVTELGGENVSLEELMARADIISLHTPLTPETHHMINAEALFSMKRGAVIINTSRGGLIDTEALLVALKSGQVGGVGLDVYEREEGVFFEDLSFAALQDDLLARLTTFPNVVITSHQGFLTEEALANIAHTVLANATTFERGEALDNEVLPTA
jgi:D-lactate dehydrogenase